MNDGITTNKHEQTTPHTAISAAEHRPVRAVRGRPVPRQHTVSVAGTVGARRGQWNLSPYTRQSAVAKGIDSNPRGQCAERERYIDANAIPQSAGRTFSVWY